MATTKKTGPHPCIAKINGLLKEQGSRLTGSIMLVGMPARATPIVVATESTEGKKRSPVVLTANFCPFCGEGL